MANIYDIAYGLGLAAAAPYWLLAPKARRKVFHALRQRRGLSADAAAPKSTHPLVMIHAVSLGEINATRELLRALAAARPDLRFLVTTTTETGYGRGKALYGADFKVTVMRYPLDFSAAVSRVLDAYRPAVAVLMELEVWPNFILHCHRRGIPVLLINGRLTASSFKNYRRLRVLLAPTFRRLRLVCAQDQLYADRFIALGADPQHVRVTGTMKFDTAQIADQSEGQESLAESVGLRAGSGPIWVCGSTGPAEETLLLQAYRQLLGERPGLRLVLVPRHPERFGQVASLVRREGFPVVRRSEAQSGAAAPVHPPIEGPGHRPGLSSLPVVLGDTMGELRGFYGLATIVFVGRSLLDLGQRQHGSDMIEPAALGKPIVIGPWTHNFAEAVNRFCEANAIKVIASAAELSAAVNALLEDAAAGNLMGRRAREVVRREQGATSKHVDAILSNLLPK